MTIKTYHELKDMLCRELEKIARKGELTPGSLETVDKLTHAIKSIETIVAMNEAREDGESGYYPHYYVRGGSYAPKRDAMGRYSRDDAHDKMIHELRELMHESPDEHTKKRFQAFIRELENA